VKPNFEELDFRIPLQATCHVIMHCHRRVLLCQLLPHLFRRPVPLSDGPSPRADCTTNLVTSTQGSLNRKTSVTQQSIELQSLCVRDRLPGLKLTQPC